MPAIICHHLFGEDAARLLPEGILRDQQDIMAFVLGSQGTDPFFTRWRALPQVARNCHELGRHVHHGEPAGPLFAARKAAARLPEEDKHVGRALVLGLLAHYVLDSCAHPFVYGQQNLLVKADPSLESGYRELHGLIESDIDSWMLWNYRHVTVLEAPVVEWLAYTERVARAGGALLSQVGLQCFDIELAPREYAHSLDDYALLYRLIDPAGSPRQRALAACERLVRPHSLLASMAHLPLKDDRSASLNLDHAAWTDPSTDEQRNESFPDLYFAALDRWPQMAEALVRGNRAGFERLSGELDYYGQPTR